MMKNYLKYKTTLSKTGKTKVVEIYNKNDINFETKLATIKWFGAWRKYCLFTEKDIVFDKNCLLEILKLLKMENENE